MTVWQSIRLVMGREFVARKRGFLIATGIVVAVATAGIVIASLVTDATDTARLTGDEANEALGFISVVLMFIGIVMTGQVVMEGVAEEKRSRVVEVVLGTMPPRHLLAGKIGALGLMAFAEIVILVAAVAVTAQTLDVFQIPAGTMVGLLSTIGWFAIGFALYSTLYGAAGAMVAPHENVSNGAIPINLGLAIPYVFAMTVGQEGDTVALQIMSHIPLFSPLIMPLRAIRGFAAPWEVALSLALTLVAIYLLVRLAGRLYAGAVMRGGKVSYRGAWRAAQHID